MMSKATIRAKARDIAREKGLVALSRASVSDALGLPYGSIHRALGGPFSEVEADLWDELGDEQTAAALRGEMSVSGLPRRANRRARTLVAITTAANAARRVGYRNVQFKMVADELGWPKNTVASYFDGPRDMQDQLMKLAVKHRVPDLVAQGLSAQDPAALAADKELKAAAAITILEG